MIRWVFLDIGGVILDEEVLNHHVFERHAEAIRLRHAGTTIDALVRERELLALAGSRWPTFDLASAYLDERTVSDLWTEIDAEVRRDYSAFLPPIAGAVESIAPLSERFSLGIIANQPAEVREVLALLGVLDRFQVVSLSEERGCFKPDPGLFRQALDEARVAAADSIMIGDRLRQDIIPATELGMKTILIRPNVARSIVDRIPCRDLEAFWLSQRRIREAEEAASEAKPDLLLGDLVEVGDLLNIGESIFRSDLSVSRDQRVQSGSRQLGTGEVRRGFIS